MLILEIIKQYLFLGFNHVIPLGFDHILFILSIFFINSNIRYVIIQCSVFTVAHSISLGLSAANLIVADPKIIEPLIAISILVTSIENIVSEKVNKWRLLVILIFGIVHGLGFASALKEIGLDKGHFLMSLLFFNIGVELGQIVVVLIAYYLISKWFSHKEWYKQRIVYPASSIIGIIALYWTIERIVG